MPVLLRPDGVARVGWDPRRAVLVRPPSGLSPTALAELLRALQSGATLAELRARFGVDAGELVTSLVDAGVVTTAERRRMRAPVDPHPRPRPAVGSAGRCTAMLGCQGDGHQPDERGDPDATDLVVRSDFLVADPRVVRELHAARVAHLPVRAARRRGSSRSAGHSGRDELPAVRGPAPQRPRCGLACRCVAATRHRRQRRPGHGFGDGSARAQPGRPGHSGGSRRRERRDFGGAAADPGHHAGVRRQYRCDRGAPMVAASPLLVLKTFVAKSLRSPHIRRG